MGITNLTELLKQRRAYHNIGITFIEKSNREEFLSYGELYEKALCYLFYLQDSGVKPKDELVLQIEDNKIFIIAFWACILGGIIPVPLSIGQTDDHKEKLFNVWGVLANPYIITAKENLKRLKIYAGSNELQHVFNVIEQNCIDEHFPSKSIEKGEIVDPDESDIAFIQFSSGSTGKPKGIMLTHKNLIANISAISTAAKYSEADTTISWMPLTHDMGLIGFHLNPLFKGIGQYLIPTQLFIRRPALWLDKVTEHKITVLCSPNFGYKYVMKHCDPMNDYTWDLSSVRIIYNGAEPISERLCAEFLDFLTIYGLQGHAMCPVYGLAEASLAVTISDLDQTVSSVTIARSNLFLKSKISYQATSEDSVSFVNVGKAIDYVHLRIVDDADNNLQEETIGHIQIKGVNVTSGCYHNTEVTKMMFSADGWLKTGDLGFLKKSQLFVTGRLKDIIFVNGQNYYPYDIERVAEGIEGIELNKIAFTGFFNGSTQKEELIAFVFHRGSTESFMSVVKSLKKLISSRMGLVIDTVIPVTNIPRTTSGKLKRFQLLEEFVRGDFKDVIEELRKLDGDAAVVVSTVKPENIDEERLINIWRNVLNKNDISTDVNFFEIGGNSLKSAEAISLINKAFRVDAEIEIIYQNPSIKELAPEIAKLEKQDYNHLPIAPEYKHYPVSLSQKRIYYSWMINPDSINYNIPIAFQIQGKVAADRLEECIKILISRHDSLKMSFEITSDPQFIIHKSIDFHLNRISYGNGQLDSVLKEQVKPFDIVCAPLFRASLLENQEIGSLLFLDFHHLISDGVSIYNFINELLDLYAGKILEPLNIQYKDYVFWEKSHLQEISASDRAYWINELNGELPLLEMPSDFKRPAVFDFKGNKIEFDLSSALTQKLRHLAKENNCTMHVLLFTCYSILLSKYTGQEDLVIGIPVTVRKNTDLHDALGMFVHNLAIRNTITGEESFSELLKRQKSKINNGLKHQRFPFDYVVESVYKKHDVSRNPIFDNMFIYQNMGTISSRNSDFSLKRHFFDPGFSKFDLSFEIFEEEDTICYAIEYAAQLFKKETIVRLAAHFVNLINNVIANPNRKIFELSIVTDVELMQYKSLNSTEIDHAYTDTVHQLFQKKAKEIPNSIALEYNEQTISYEELNRKTDHLALQLRKAGIRQNCITGILLRRSPELIIAIIGVLKSGGSYLPIDPGLPEERINYIIKQSKCKVLITQEDGVLCRPNFIKLQADLNLQLIKVAENGLDLGGSVAIENISSPDDLAYVIYTSGTTGNPKGVMITHKSLTNYIVWAANRYSPDRNSSYPLYTSISFDLTITSIFTPLITGNRIVIYQEDDHELLLEQVIIDNKCTVVKLTPSHLKLLGGYRNAQVFSESIITTLIVGGEQLDTWIAKKVYDNFGGKIEILNEYGPTEATVGCMIHKFNPYDDLDVVPIGKPIANTSIYILDEFLKPVPVGINGEIYISGHGIAHGYLFEEELTEEKFVSNPFAEGQLMYKTGDVAKRLSNGNITYVGRRDSQVKFNGYRIELSEIESYLNKHRCITEAIVVLRKNEHDQSILCAYYKSTSIVSEKELRNFLILNLPYYMIPSYFIQVDKLPLTNNGKINYQGLPDPIAAQKVASRDLNPKNKIEELLLDAWRAVFNDININVTDNFFELGGDSIKAVQIISRIQGSAFELKVKDILTFQSIEQISLHVQLSVSHDAYEQGIVEGEKKLSPIESWFFNQHFDNHNYYNQSVLLKFNREVDVNLLKKAFKKLIEHHDSLRLNYNSSQHTLFYNNTHLDKNFEIEKHQIKLPKVDAFSVNCPPFTDIKGSFDISKSLLIKAAIAQINDTQKLLFITIHHLVTDGLSWRILLEDLYTIYSALENNIPVRLFRKTATLLDWEKALSGYAASERLGVDKKFWHTYESLNFSVPVDFETPDWSIKNLHQLSGNLNEEETEFLLKGAHSAYKTDVAMLLNMAAALTLKEWTGLNVVVIEQENYGRQLESIDTSRTLGWFTAMYPLKLELTADSLGAQIMSVKEQIKCVPNAGIGYNIKKYYNQPLGNEANQLSEIRLNYLGQFGTEMENTLFSFCDGLTGSDIDPKNQMTTKLELNLMVLSGKLVLNVSYNKTAHKEASVIWFIRQFFASLEQILQHLKGQEEIYFTPSDFDSVSLNQDELDDLFS